MKANTRVEHFEIKGIPALVEKFHDMSMSDDWQTAVQGRFGKAVSANMIEWGVEEMRRSTDPLQRLRLLGDVLPNMFVSALISTLATITNESVPPGVVRSLGEQTRITFHEVADRIEEMGA